MGHPRLYKLTTQDFKTRKGCANECTWGPGVTHSGTGEGDLCGPGYIHAYTSPLLAVLLNPIHASIKNPVLWECSHSGVEKNDKGLKVGCLSLCTVKQIPLPEISLNQKIAFSILCAMSVCKTSAFTKWALAWLDGSNRVYTTYAAAAAYAATYAATYAASSTVADAVASAAANAASNAAYAAADAASSTVANAVVASAAADADAVASAVAIAAADAAYTAPLDLIALAEKALTYD